MRCPRILPPGAIVALLALTMAFFALACTDDDADPGLPVTRPAPSGSPRSVALGLAALPAERSQPSYLSVFATAAQYGEVVMVQRPPPWADFLPGAKVSESTEATTKLEVALLEQYDHLRLFYAVDPTDPAVSRTRIAEPPAGVDVFAGFRDPGLRAAFVNYAAYVAKAYQPAYLALGVEVNMLYERDRPQFDAFLTLYAEAYRVAKAASPSTKVLVTFQLDDLEGKLGDPHPARWEVVQLFDGQLDALAVTTYPYLAGLRSATELRPGFWQDLAAQFDGEIIIAGTAAASSPVEGESSAGNEEEQDTYLARALEEAEREGISLVIWSVPFDPVYARSGSLLPFRDAGLRRSEGANKLAWTTWEAWALRPRE